MKGLGATIKHMGTEHISMLMEQLMWENGSKINSMEEELRNGRTELSMKVTMKMEKNMEKVV